MIKKIKNVIFTGSAVIAPTAILVSCVTTKPPTFTNYELLSNLKNDTTIEAHIINLPKHIKAEDVTLSIRENAETSNDISVAATKIEGEKVTFKFNNLKSKTNYKLIKIEINDDVINIDNAKEFSLKKDESDEKDPTKPLKPFNPNKPIEPNKPITPPETAPPVSPPETSPPVKPPPLRPVPKGTYEIYDKFSELTNPKLNFINKNFKADQIAERKYRKNYRLHQLFRNSIWKFDKQSNSFSWSVDEQWINNMILRDKGNVSNINLYLYIENTTPSNSRDISDITRPIFRDYLEKQNMEDMNRYSQDNYYPLGIKFDWAKLKDYGNLTISTPKYFDVEVNYDPSQKIISFKIVAKPGINFTDEPHIAQQGKHVLISGPDNFLSISFETDNNDNKTIQKFTTPSKAEEGANVNAFDLSTVVKNIDNANIKNDENRYMLAGKVIENNNNNEFLSEMEARTFSNNTGTWTMWAKVKPSDPNDQRYYVFTNQHVKPVLRNNYDANLSSGFKLYKQVGRSSFPDLNEPPLIVRMMPFWGFKETEDRWGKKIIANKFSNSIRSQILNRDMQVSIIDLKNVFAEIDGYLEKNKFKVEVSSTAPKLKILRGFFEKWATFKPLEFTDDYKLINSSSWYLDDWIITSHAFGLAQSLISKFTAGNVNKPEFTKEEYVSNNETRKRLILVKGASGSLIVRGDKKLIGINNQLRDSNFGQFFYTSQLDSIGSNVDGSDPSKNINPTTLGRAIIEAHEKYPDQYEILDMFK